MWGSCIIGDMYGLTNIMLASASECDWLLLRPGKLKAVELPVGVDAAAADVVPEMMLFMLLVR